MLRISLAALSLLAALPAMAQDRGGVPRRDPTAVLNIDPDVPNAGPDVEFFSDMQERFTAIANKVVNWAPKAKQRYKNQPQAENADDFADGTSLNPARGNQSTQTEGQVRTEPDDPPNLFAPTFDNFISVIAALRGDAYADKISFVKTEFGAELNQAIYKEEYVIPVQQFADEPGKWHRAGKDLLYRSRGVLLAHVAFCNGQHYLLGEIERIRKHDKFSVFCCRVSDDMTKNPTEFVLAVTKTVSNRQRWPTWHSETQTFEIGEKHIPGKRLLHTEVIKPVAQYVARLLQIGYPKVSLK